MRVDVVPIDASNWRETLEVLVPEPQLRFVADHQPVALVILAKAYVRPGGHEWEPLAIVDRPAGIVGVLALEHQGDKSELRNFAVDGRSQRRGVGGAAIEALIRHVRATRPASTTMLVSAHPENERALRLYQRSGFEPTGSHKGIEPILARRLDG